MHRTKLKDMAAQTYIRWLELLVHCQPQWCPLQPPELGGEGSGQALTRARARPPPLQLLSCWLRDEWRGCCGGRGDAWRPFIILIKSKMPNVGHAEGVEKLHLHPREGSARTRRASLS